MILNTDAAALETYLRSSEDCEEISAGEYVADIYDTEIPVTLNISVRNGKTVCEAAAYLLYDEEQAGWYMGEQISDPALIEGILSSVLNA